MDCHIGIPLRMYRCSEQIATAIQRITKEEITMENLNLNEMEAITGGLVVADPEQNKFWIIRQNGTVIAPAPTEELAIEFARQFQTSPTVITKEEYKTRFGRDLVW